MKIRPDQAVINDTLIIKVMDRGLVRVISISTYSVDVSTATHLLQFPRRVLGHIDKAGDTHNAHYSESRCGCNCYAQTRYSYGMALKLQFS